MSRSPQKTFTQIPSAVKEQIVIDAASMTTSELSRKHAASRTSVRKILLAAGVSAKKHGFDYANFDWSEIDKELGLTATDIDLALKYEISPDKARMRRHQLGREPYKPQLGWRDDGASSAEIKRNAALADLMYTWKRSCELRRYIHFANKWRHTLRLIRCS